MVCGLKEKFGAMTDSAFLGLRCTRCGAEFEGGRSFAGCRVCADGDWTAGLEATYDFEQARRAWGRGRADGLWRYAPLLPLRDEASRVTLGEGATPLIAIPGLHGVRDVWVKNETANPTWSYKDRMCAVGVSVAVEMGSSVIGISSTSNQGASGSAYASRAGLRSVVLTLEEVEDPALAFMQAYGALVATTSRLGRRVLLRHGVEKLGWFPISSYTSTPTSNPYAIEGYKTIAYEIVEDLGSAPAAVVVPTALGEGLAGIHAGFRDLKRIGLIEQVPRMVAAELAGGAPLSKTLREGAERPLPVAPHVSIAMTLATTVATDRALLAVRESTGGAVPVSDDELLAAQALLRASGLLAEPAGSAAVAALPHLAEVLPGFDPLTQRVAVVMTGTGLRELPVLRSHLPPVPRLEPDPAAFERVLQTWSATRSAVWKGR
jgi:threonine synthase